MALNRTTDNSSRTSQTTQRYQLLETNNIHQTENVLLFRNLFNDINDYFYFLKILFLNKQEIKESLETQGCSN